MRYRFDELTEWQRAYVVYTATQYEAETGEDAGFKPDIVLTVNGLEINFLAVCDRVMKNMNHAANIRARDIIGRELGDIQRNIEIMSEISEIVIRQLRGKNIED